MPHSGPPAALAASPSSSSLMSFDADTALRSAGPGLFDLDVPASWRVRSGAVNGGYVAAVLTRGLAAVVADAGRRPRSLTVHYVAGCRPGPARLAVSVERTGRSVTTLSARLVQEDTPVALALAAFGEDRPGLDFQHRPMPEAPPPEEVPGWPRTGHWPAFRSNWDHRPCVGPVPFSGGAEAVSGGWIRPDPPCPLDAPVMAAMADAWLPPVLPLFDRPGGTLPTIDLTIHFRAPLPPPDAPEGSFAFAVFESRLGAQGYWESDGVIWSPSGRVLAQARQLAAFNRYPA
jgi:acyl-CoA thioesterase